MENYFCFYNAGLSGTWLTWFVNQHSSFPQYEYEELDTDGTITDLCCDGATWCFMKDPEDGAPDDALSFDEYLVEYDQPCSTNKVASKRCIKVLPDHDLSEAFTEHMHQQVLSYAHKIIMPVLSPNSKMLDSYAHRLMFMWNEDYNTYVENIAYLYELSKGDHYSNKYNKPIHFVHIDNLINGDDEEYKKLCEFIGDTPLDSWKDIVTDYRVQFIEKKYL